MDIIERFENFASDFELSLKDDNWDRLKKHLRQDATYQNVGSPDRKSVGRDQITAFLKKDVDKVDRRFDSRTLVGLTQPSVEGNKLSRRWRCTYRLSGTPDLVVEGEARYLFEGEQIKSIEQELTQESELRLLNWINDYGEYLK
jgi:hypothetical protein